MTTIKLEFGKMNRHKERQVSFLVCHKGTKKRIPTEVVLRKEDVSPGGKRVKNRSKAHALETIRRNLQDRLCELAPELVGKQVDAAFVVRRMLAGNSSPDFFEFADQWVEQTAVKGKKNYASALNALERFWGRRQMAFEEMDFSMLKRFELSLSDRPRAMSLYLGALRHLFREGMRRYNTDVHRPICHDPFSSYRPPRQQARRRTRALGLDALLSIYRYQGTPQSRSQLGRDCFILSFCLMGINSVDLFECSRYRNGVLAYNRAKTRDRRSDGAYIEVEVHPFLDRLMARYADSSRVFNFHRRFSTAGNFNASVNAGLKEVGRAVGLPHLDFYCARHTFATLSRNLMRFSKSDVDEALNHIGSLELADVYIAKDFSIINENNRQLIEAVFKDYL